MSAPDFTAFDAAVTAIRPANPKIAHAFDETRKLLGGTVTPPAGHPLRDLSVADGSTARWQGDPPLVLEYGATPPTFVDLTTSYGTKAMAFTNPKRASGSGWRQELQEVRVAYGTRLVLDLLLYFIGWTAGSTTQAIIQQTRDFDLDYYTGGARINDAGTVLLDYGIDEAAPQFPPMISKPALDLAGGNLARQILIRRDITFHKTNGAASAWRKVGSGPVDQVHAPLTQICTAGADFRLRLGTYTRKQPIAGNTFYSAGMKVWTPGTEPPL